MTSAPDSVRGYLIDLQNRICERLSEEDESRQFHEDDWSNENGGGGRTRILRGDGIFEQAGVNFSHVMGDHLPASASAERPNLSGTPFEAMGVSLVIHPLNPYVPTSHMNVRYFEASPEEGDKVWWFGGGVDLTPYYGFTEDAVQWHRSAYDACKPFGAGIYEQMKRRCDEYFFLRHRQEQRGIGGLFFDDLSEGGFDHAFALMRSVGDHFLPAYLPIVQRRRGLDWGQREREFQLYRRGRYVEFNLVYDRGTLFGLQSGGRTESILMSLPPAVSWRYDWHPEPATPEDRLYRYFLQPRNWLAEDT